MTVDRVFGGPSSTVALYPGSPLLPQATDLSFSAPEKP
jgi:hypothetical protein